MNPDPTNIVVGKDERGRPVCLPLRARLSHTLILGATGSGKSRLLLHYMRQLIKRGEGLLFLDPHGSHPDSDYRNLLVWLSKAGVPVTVIDLTAPNVAAFNPLACPPDTDPSVIAGNVMDALAIEWEGESFSQKPSIERVLTAVLIALVELKLTLCKAPILLERADSEGLRADAIDRIADNHSRDVLKALDELAKDGRRKRDFDQETVGPLNRLARLLRPRVLQQMLGQRDGIDLRSIMDKSGIVLANLSGGTKVYDPDLVGRLLTRTVLFEAERRANTKPFTVVLDEAHRFLSPDIPKLLAEVRKRGVSIVAAMQWLEQSGDPNIRAALLNVNCKIAFRIPDAIEAESLARSLMPLDLERPIEALVKPVVVGHRRSLFANHSEGESESETRGRAEAVSEGQANSTGESVSKTRAESETVATIEGLSESAGSSEGTSESASEIMLPVMQDGIFAPDPFITRVISGTGASGASSKGTGKSSATSEAFTSMRAETQSRSVSRSVSSARSKMESAAQTQGTSRTRGASEALEPVMERLPTAVHGLQNELYRCGLMLRSMPTAVGYISFVGPRGAVRTFFKVPELLMTRLSDERFAAIRDRLLPPPLEPEPVWTPPAPEPSASAPPPSPSARQERGEAGW